MKQRPDTYAKELVKRNGKALAARIASGTRKTMEVAMMDPNPNSWGTPFSAEVEISEQTEVQNGKVMTRVHTFVHQDRKLARLKKTYNFWVNVVNYLAKRYPEEFQPKDA